MDTLNLLGRDYAPRVIDERLDYLLSVAGAVVIEGPRACGKTMTAVNAARSAIFLDTAEAQELLVVDPQLVLNGEVPRLIDEWQVDPQVWNRVRREVDFRSQDGQFILTGSAVPDDDSTRHTGAGRFLRLRQRTMTWFERGLSEERVSLAELFAGRQVVSRLEKPNIEDVLNNVCVSGFPAHIHRSAEDTAVQMSAYAEEVSRTDVRVLADLRHDPETIMQLMRALARGTATEVTFKTIASDLATVAPTIRPETVAKYVSLLERLFVVEAVKPWSGKLRSKANMRRSSKYHLADPALSAALLGATPERLLQDLETAGFIFESAVLHDLAVYVEALGGHIRHYRDSNGNEIDAILELPDGRWGAVEVKLGGGAAQKASEDLTRIASIIDASQPPAFRTVITGTGMTLTYPNGVSTFPLSALSP